MADSIPETKKDELVLAFDFGSRRIGVAIGEAMLGRARPLTTLNVETNDARFMAIGRLIAEWRPARLVVGLPRSLDGHTHEMTERCQRFARQLEGRHRLPVTLIDERFSSAAADEDLRRQGVGWPARKVRIDAEAAAILLQNYFDERHHELATPDR